MMKMMMMMMMMMIIIIIIILICNIFLLSEFEVEVMTQQRDGPCFKHSVQWRSRVEWLTNKLRPRIEPVLRGRNLKPVQFVDAFRNLLCICGDLKQKHHLKQINGINK